MSDPFEVLPRPSDHVLFTELPDGDAVLLDLQTEAYFGLNALAKEVWNVLASQGDLPGLVDRIESESGERRDTIRADIGELIDDLVERGLVVR